LVVLVAEVLAGLVCPLLALPLGAMVVRS